MNSRPPLRPAPFSQEMLHLDVPKTGEHLLMAGEKDHELFPEIVSILEGVKKQKPSKSA